MEGVDTRLRLLIEEQHKQRQRRLYRPALAEVRRLLDRAIERYCELDDPQRIVVRGGRVKSDTSILAKAQRMVADGAKRPRSYEDIERLLGDVVGVRVICKTLRDVSLAGEAIAKLCAAEPALEPAREVADYVHTPKPSGYRSIHYVLMVPVRSGADTVAVPCEIQVRTHLQDAWGELTHENSYKSSASALPELHLEIARHMADMLYEIDKLALTLADATDELLRDAAEETPSPRPGDESLAAGTEHLGRVVATGRDYALVVVGRVQGLLGAVEIRELLHSARYIAAKDLLAVGDVITVQVKEHDPARRRLVLTPTRAEEFRR